MPLGASMMLPFPNQDHIALVVRGKTSRNAAPPGNGHADVILPSGAPAGFFVHPREEAGGTTATNVPGCVYGYSTYSSYRPYYVNLADAHAGSTISGVLMIRATSREQNRFEQAWQYLRSRPGNFSIVGFNCASHAAIAFSHAGLAGLEIPGVDTPDNLFHALRARHASRCRDEYGYLGFLPRESAMDEMMLTCEVGMDGTRPVTGPGPAPPRRGMGHGGRPGL